MMGGKRAFEEASTEVARHEAEHRALGDIDHLTATKTDLNNKIRENKNQLTTFKVCTKPLFLLRYD